jgi:hypothetical protein
MENYKEYTNKKWLGNRYLKYKSVSKIANECGVAINTISRWLSYFGLRKKRNYQGNQKGQNNSFWNGGKYIDRLNGYVKVHSPDHPSANNRGYIFEHRLVMEKSLGRYLRKNEIIHHRNKRKDDNRADNLELIVLGEVNGGDVMCPHCNKIFKLS